jgi:6-bladed beta-propeller
MKIHAGRNIDMSLFLSVFLINLVISAPAQSQKPGWKGNIEVENGVKVIRNPSEPLFGEFVFDLEEDLRMGGDPTIESTYFSNGLGVRVRPDEKGNLYVVDQMTCRVLLFDPNGKLIRMIGHKGQGPGEYQSPFDVFIGSGQTYVYGIPEMVVFAPDGIFLRKVNPRTFLSQAILGPGGSIIGTLQPSALDGFKQKLVQLDAKGTMVRTIAEYNNECADNSKGMVSHWYSSNIAFTPLTADSYAYGYSADYKIWISDGEGKSVVVLTKEEKPASISGKEKDETRKKGGYFAWYWIGSKKPADSIIFPDHKPYFSYGRSAFKNDDRGRLYVGRLISILEKKGPYPVDVFSKDGVYLYRMSWPFIPAAIERGAMYRVLTDEDTGECFIIRYKIKNWTNMKSGVE